MHIDDDIARSCDCALARVPRGFNLGYYTLVYTPSHRAEFSAEFNYTL